VLAGDVGFASGQSNMEMEVKGAANAPAEIAAANYPRIRLFRALNKVSPYPLEDIAAFQWGDSTWTQVSPDTIASSLPPPTSWAADSPERGRPAVRTDRVQLGRTPAEAWTSLHGLGADVSLMPVFAEWAR